MSFPLADPVSIASAALQLHEASTQQMFDTQFAAAGLESQISGMSSEDDFPIPSTEPFRSSKRRRISGDGCYQSTPVAKSPPPAVAHTISQQSFHSLTQASSQERRDSLSAEVQVPENPDAHVEDSLALSPSTRMEVEIDAWRTRQEETTRVIPKNETASPGQDFMVSSILPDSYGLSKSDSSSKSSDAKHSGNQRSGKGIHDTFGAAQRSPEDAHQQRYEDQEELRPRVQFQEVLRIKNTATVFDVVSSMAPTRKQRASVPLYSTPNVEETRSSVRTPLTPWQPTGHTTVIRDFADGLPTPTIQCSPAPKLVARKAQPKASTRDGTAATDHDPSRTVIDALQRFPRHIFANDLPGPSTETQAPAANQGQAACPPQSGSTPPSSLSVSQQRAVMVERHMLYRRKMHRTLEPFERGYWTFNMSQWTPESKRSFLCDVQTHVENSQFGAGSWVDLHFNKQRLPSSGDLYCSAIELGEAWLLLMVLSNRKLAEHDMHWTGWDGEPALTMPGKPGKSIAGSM